MCGIVGFFDKRLDAEGPVGKILLSLLTALGRRGPDSAGAALYGDPQGFVVRVKLGERGDPSPRAAEVGERARALTRVRAAEVQGHYLRLVVEAIGDLRAFEAALEVVHPEVEVVSVGRRLEIMKELGAPAKLEITFGLSAVRGSHGIGHSRLSTESRVDLSHSQPFWAHGTLDLAVVHNGHITNYHKLRRRYEQRGIRYYTENDSEVIGIYLADRMGQGLPFEEALRASVRDLDGSFSYLAATAEGLGYAKDPFCLKPLIVAETDEFVALVNEEGALRTTFEGDFQAREPSGRQVRAWFLPSRNRQQAA
ncbi:MAG: glutamine phosphoribosylpyrophosphate amidotransferase [Candidatus Rokubacteria bacterium]|nr:glutamine phosphoribosylpyrophosphate amidotransferase [Candidatus Rokubacteria bacterium]